MATGVTLGHQTEAVRRCGEFITVVWVIRSNAGLPRVCNWGIPRPIPHAHGNGRGCLATKGRADKFIATPAHSARRESPTNSSRAGLRCALSQWKACSVDFSRRRSAYANLNSRRGFSTSSRVRPF